MDFVAARKHMVDSQIRCNDVTDIRIQNAMAKTPRERFLPASLRAFAYAERELVYGGDNDSGRALPTARDFAKLLAAAGPRASDLVLDIACGGGYSTAVLAALSEMVVAIESDEALATSASDALSAENVTNAVVIQGDPVAGAPDQGPYDLIMIAGLIEKRPDALLSQLKEGGRLAALSRVDGVARGVVYRRDGDTISARDFFDASARHVVPGFEKKAEFSF